MPRLYTVFLTFDDDVCEPLARMLHSMLPNDSAILNSGAEVSVRLLPITPGASQQNTGDTSSVGDAAMGGASENTHREVLYRQLQENYSLSHDHMFVISLLKGANHDEYSRITELCVKSNPPIESQVISHIGNFNDVGLIARNLTRRLSAFVAPQLM